jgi:hypothetical protein
MTKETVRFPDGLVDRMREAVDDSELFESRSEFHRVSSELLLDLLDSEHEPTNFSYRELRTEIEAELGVDLAGPPSLAGDAGGEGDFFTAYVEVRRRALGGDLAGAREVIDRRYDPTHPEALLLEEVIGHHREAHRVVETGQDAGTGPHREPDREESEGGDLGRAGSRPRTSADGGAPETHEQRSDVDREPEAGPGTGPAHPGE